MLCTKIFLKLFSYPFFFVFASVVAADGPQEFPLQDYVPVNFYRQNFLVSPNLNLGTGNRVIEPQVFGEPNRDFQGEGALSLHHDYLKFSHTLEFSGTSESELNASQSSYSSGSNFNQTAFSNSNGQSERASFYVSAFSNHAAKWYLTEKLSLGARLEPKITQGPRSKSTQADRTIDQYRFPNFDSTVLQLNFNTSQTESRAFDLRFSLSIGYGRIHNVTFAARILFLLDRIKEQTGKHVQLNLTEMAELESFIESLRKVRPFYDTRLADIFDLESLEKYLRKKAELAHFPARALLEMADEWHFAQWQERLSGWEVRFFPYFQSQFLESSDDYAGDYNSGQYPVEQLDTKQEFLSLSKGDLAYHSTTRSTRDFFNGTTIAGLGASFAYSLPYHRFYQVNGSLTTRFEKRRVETGSTSSDRVNPPMPVVNETPNKSMYLVSEYPKVELGLNLSGAFFPSTRTSISLIENINTQVNFDYLGNKQALTDYIGRIPYQDSRVFNSSLTLKIDYFLGHRLSLDVFGTTYHSVWQVQDIAPGSANGIYVERYGYQAGHSSSFRIGSGLKYYLF